MIANHDIVQISVRNVSPELERRLKEVARERGESVNTTVLRLLEASVGVSARRARLARYATWAEGEVEEIEGAVRLQRVVDPKLWR